MQEPMDPVQFEQMRRELEAQTHRAEAPDWAREFRPGMEELQQQPAFSPGQFEAFRNAQMIRPAERNGSPMSQQQSMYQSPMGMSSYQRPMYNGMGVGGFQSRFAGSSFQQQPQQQFEGKGKGRVQELDDATWQQQFDALNVQGEEADLEQLDREAEEAVERELNGIDR